MYHKSDPGNLKVEEDGDEIDESSEIAPGEMKRETLITSTDEKFLSMLQSSHHTYS
jgi:hypothetical protein